ncbi:hypothetical protein [Frankia sp. AiPs1]
MTRWPAPRQSKATQPWKPRPRSSLWTTQVESTARCRQGTPGALLIGKSADTANPGTTQHSPAHRPQSARNRSRTPVTSLAVTSVLVGSVRGGGVVGAWTRATSRDDGPGRGRM